MEDLRTTTSLVFQNYHMVTLDLQDAYFLIPVHVHYRKYLRFKFKNKYYQFIVLPFGMCTCPYVFTKVFKPVISYLRSLGYTSVVYLDDIFLIERTEHKVSESLSRTIEILESLGFMINYRKSQLVPSKSCKYLGFIIDSETCTVSLTEEKRENIGQEVRKMLNKGSCSIQQFSEFLDKLVAACPGVEYGWLYTKVLEAEKVKALEMNNQDYTKKMLISPSIIDDLQWWRKASPTTFNNIKSNEYSMTIYTDASRSGYGATNETAEISGPWNEHQKSKHINFLELLCVKIALETLAEHSKNCQILLRIDNSTAIAYVNKLGGTRVKQLNDLAREIWQWAEKRNIFLVASYIPSKENIIADGLSRKTNVDTEWELASYAFRQIVNIFGSPKIDLFASTWNAKCEQFVTWYPERGGHQVDAFTFPWEKLQFYAFPPFSQILRTLTKIKRERAEGILVVPKWQNQPWYPLFLELLIEEPIIFEPDQNLLISVDRKTIHRRAEHLYLMAGRVSGKPSY